MPLENYLQSEAIPTIWRQIYSVMGLPFHLKVCYIYLCVYRPSIEISTRQLYQLWVAEGFIPYNSEETAEHYLKELIHRVFIQVREEPEAQLKRVMFQVLYILHWFWWQIRRDLSGCLTWKRNHWQMLNGASF